MPTNRTASGVPLVDFSTLGDLGDVYNRGKLIAARQQLGQAFKDGKVDYGTGARILAEAGDMEGAMSFAKLGEAAGYRAEDRAWRQQEASRAQSNADRVFAAQQEARDEGRVPVGFRRAQSGGLEPVPGGPTDPTYIAQTSTTREKPRQLGFDDVDKLSKEGSRFSQLSDFVGSFEDRFGGYGTQGAGNLASWAGRYIPEAVIGKNTADASGWWQSYDNFKNEARREMAGTAQSVQETANFNRANVDPGMTPKKIRENLATQRKILRRVVANKAGALVNEGFNPETISRAYGFGLDELGANTARVPRGTPSGAVGGGGGDAGRAPSSALPATPIAPQQGGTPQSGAANASSFNFSKQQVIDEARAAMQPSSDGRRRDPALIAKKLRELGIDPREAGIEE